VTRPTHAEALRAVGGHSPTLVGPRPTEGWDRRAAATALILADLPTGPEVLFIERATRPGDRWSGQMALPGGRHDPTDPDLAATAVRETAEEVGVALGPAVGRLDDVGTRDGARGFVATFVHTTEGRPATVPEPAEVATCVWIPLAHLLDPDSAVRHRHRAMGPFAGIRYDRFTVWGLTHGILTGFAEVLGRDLPRPRGPLLG
jgi:8-oxo-dGTP pyrophosphatase MutT (NUDIX family)